MKAIIIKTGYDYDFDIQELEIPENHIHMVIKGEPKQPQSCYVSDKKYLSKRIF
jgi:putative transposase